MKYYGLTLILVLGFLLSASGCTTFGKLGSMGSSEQNIPKTTPSSLKPSPTDYLPPDLWVEVQVNQKDPSYATVTTIFAGGKGQNMVKDIAVQLTCSDGSVLTGSVQPQKLSELTLQGTRGTDRIEVRVTMLDGKTYKIVDKEVPFKNLAGH